MKRSLSEPDEDAEVKRPEPPRYYKMLTPEMVHHGFQYKAGLNIDTVEWNPCGDCLPGGLYYTEFEHIGRNYQYGWTLIADVTIPADAKTYEAPDQRKWKADRLELSNIRSLAGFLADLDPDLVTNWAMAQNSLVNLLEPTHPACFALVNKERCALESFPKHSAELCKAAVLAHPHAVLHVQREFLTEELQLLAVKGDPSMFKDMQQTEQLCWAALKVNPKVINWIKEPTREMYKWVIDQAMPGSVKFTFD